MSTETQEVKPPSVFEKITFLIAEFDDDLAAMKVCHDTMRNRQKLLKKQLAKMQNKVLKQQNKPKTNRKPCGFARPSLVSNDMCDFMKLPHGSLVSRTEVTKALIQYIKDHKLQNEANKRQILPDETLYKIFGEASKSTDLTYFTMQKFVNHHFPKSNNSSK